MWKWPVADLTGIVLRGIAQHVQIAGFLAIIAIYGSTPFTMGGLKNTNVCVMKSEKMQWCYEKKVFRK